MASIAAHALIGFTSAKAGGAAILGARNAGFTQTAIVRKVAGVTGPTAAKVTYQRINLVVQTTSRGAVLAHAAKSADEAVILNYDADDGERFTTFAACAPIGTEKVTFPDKGQAGYSPRTALRWALLEDAVHTLLAHITDAAGTG